MHGLKLLTPMVVLILLMSVLTISMPTALAQETEGEVGEKTKTDMLLKILEKAKGRVEQAIARLEAKGVAIPDEAKNSYENGLSLTEEAVKLRDAGKYDDACSKAVEAMQSFREALRLAEKAVPPEVTEEEAMATKAIGLRVAVDRAYRTAYRIKAMVGRVKGEYYVTGVESKVNEAKSHVDEASSHLGKASTLLDEGDIDGAAKELGTARKLLGQAMGELSGITKAIKFKKAERFLEKAEKRMAEFKERLTKLAEKLPAPARAAIAERLERMNRSLAAAEEHAKAKKIGSLIRSLRESREHEEESIKFLERHRAEVAEMFRSLRKLELKAASVEERLSRLQALGIDVSEAREALEQAKVKIGEARDYLEAYRLDKAEEAVGMAEGLIEQAQERLKEHLATAKSRVEAALENLKERIKNLEDKMEKLEGKSVEQVQVKLQGLHRLIKLIEMEIEMNNFEDAWKLLDQAESALSQVESLLEGLLTVTPTIPISNHG